MSNVNGHVNKGYDSKNEHLDDIKVAETNGEDKQPPPNSTDEPNTERVVWDKPIEFLMSCIAMNVGLGNIWRFPFVAYENGGGAFLIPYVMVLLLMGRPMYYLETCLGQFSSRGNVKMFENLAPILKGVGFGQLIATLCVATYYCSLMAITLFYFVNSFTSNLPWSTCNPSWTTVEWVAADNITCIPSNSDSFNSSIVPGKTMSSSELYFRVDVLNEYVDISNGIGAPDWRMALCLLVSWLVTFGVCARGIQSSGKASYFLAIFPYVIIFTLLIRALTLDGSSTGILYFISPQWEKLLDAKVWYAAVTQCFFSLNIGFGSVSMYASYNGFRHNVYRDALVVSTLDTCTSLLAGTIIFGILGNLAFKMNVDVKDVVTSGGTGLAFISYPEAIARFEVVPWVFAVLFFGMLFILGVGSLVSLQGCAITVIMDAFPYLKIWHVSLATAVSGFIIGLVYIVPGGQWIFTMVDFFAGTIIFFIMNIMEVTAIMWWYGLENICQDIEFMTKRKPGVYWRFSWGLLIPVVLIMVLIYFFATFEPLTYEQKTYPTKIIVWGWILLGVGILQPILWFNVIIVKKMRNTGLNIKETLEQMVSHADWGPQKPETKQKWLAFKEQKRTDRESKKRGYIRDKLCILIGR